jgi:long-chain acyl-CoA synthetase
VLLVPDMDKLRVWAAAEGITEADDEALVARAEVRSKMAMEAKRHFRDLAQFEVPKKFVVLSQDFSIERGELTPKLSVRRKIVEQNYREQIAAAYNDPAE